MIIHVHRLLITRRNFTMLYLFEVLALVVGQSQGLFVADLHFRGVITWVRKVVDHFLHGFELLLPPGHMRVHVLNQCARWSSFHLLHSYVTPSLVVLWQVREKKFDFEQLTCKLFWSQILVFDVVSNGFLRNVFLVSIKLCCEESRDTFYSCVYHRSYFLFNNNKSNPYYNYILKYSKDSLLNSLKKSQNLN